MGGLYTDLLDLTDSSSFERAKFWVNEQTEKVRACVCVWYVCACVSVCVCVYVCVCGWVVVWVGGWVV